LTLTADTTLPGFSGDDGYDRKSTGLVFNTLNYSASADSPVRYDAARRGFTFYFSPVFFRHSEDGAFSLARDNANSTASFSQYYGTAGDNQVRVTQLNPGSSNPTLPLQYCSLVLAKATYVDPTTGAIGVGVEPLSFGLMYDWDKQTLHGSAVYKGILLGLARGQGSNHVYDLDGTVEIDLDYDTSDFTGSIHLTGRDDKSGKVVDLGIIPLKADPPRGTLDYFYSATTAGDQMQSAMAGSKGQEFMGVFDAHMADPQSPSVTMKIAAAFAAKRSELL